jgi:hypothetical protein
VTEEAPVDRGAGGRCLELAVEPAQDGAGTPSGVGPSKGHDPGLHLRGGLVGTAVGPGASICEGS